MITETNIGEIDRSSDFAEQSFGFASSAKGFKILTSKLYENPPFSVIQELSANAYDSHVVAGCADKQFVVHLPNKLEPHFSIRDFGVSMNHEFMMTKYTLVFYSTKVTSNDTNGAWGLGRLTGLACSDTYLVMTFLNGEKKTYNIFINEQGVPAIAYINSETTEEPNGVEVHIPVPDVKIHEFVSGAERIYRNYIIRPIFKGTTPHFTEYKFSLKGQNWALEENADSAMAIMGVYAYPIHKASIPNLTAKEQLILSEGFFFYFNIGDLDVTASRDGLSYEDKTCIAIKSVLSVLQSEYDKKIQDAFDNCPTIKEAYGLYYKFFSYSGELNGQGRLTSDNFVPTWNGINITSHCLLSTGNASHNAYRYSCGSLIRSKEASRSPVALNRPDTYVYLKGPEPIKAPKRRVSGLFEDQIIPLNSLVYVIDFESEEAKTQYSSVNNLALFDFPLLSSVAVPKTERTETQRQYTTKSFKKVFKFNFQSALYSKNSDSWDIDTVDVANGVGYYVTLDRFIITDLPGVVEPRGLSVYLHDAQTIDASLSSLVVHGIRISQQDKIGPGWIPLTKHIDNLISAKLTSLNLDLCYEGYMNYMLCKRDKTLVFIESIDASTLPPHSLLAKTIEQIKAYKVHFSNFEAYKKTFSKVVASYTNSTAKLIDIDAIKDNLQKTYPMFGVMMNMVTVSYYYFDCETLKPAIIDYVNLLQK